MSDSSRAVSCAVGSKIQIALPYQSGGAPAVTLSSILTEAQISQALALAASDAVYHRQLLAELAAVKRTQHCDSNFLTFFHMVRELYKR